MRVSYLVFFFIPALLFAQPKVEVVWEVPVSIDALPQETNITIYRHEKGDEAMNRIVVWSRHQVEIFNNEGKKVMSLPKAYLYAVSPRGRYILKYFRDSTANVYSNPTGEMQQIRFIKGFMPIDIRISETALIGIIGYEKACLSRHSRCPKTVVVTNSRGQVLYTSNEEIAWWVRFSIVGRFWAVHATLTDSGRSVLHFGSQTGTLWSREFDKNDWAPSFNDAFIDESSETIALRGTGWLTIMDFSNHTLGELHGENIAISEPIGTYLLSGNVLQKLSKKGTVEDYYRLPQKILPLRWNATDSIKIARNFVAMCYRLSSLQFLPRRAVVMQVKGATPFLDVRGDIIDLEILDSDSFVLLRNHRLLMYRVRNEN